jgi:hypothetical protein
LATATDIKTRFPGAFDTLADNFIEAIIAEAALEISETVWGRFYQKGLIFLTAHFLYCLPGSAPGGGGATGSISSQSVGDVSVSFATAAPISLPMQSLSSSSYGQEFLRLRRLLQGGPVTAAAAASEPANV